MPPTRRIPTQTGPWPIVSRATTLMRIVTPNPITQSTPFSTARIPSIPDTWHYSRGTTFIAQDAPRITMTMRPTSRISPTPRFTSLLVTRPSRVVCLLGLRDVRPIIRITRSNNKVSNRYAIKKTTVFLFPRKFNKFPCFVLSGRTSPLSHFWC